MTRSAAERPDRRGIAAGARCSRAPRGPREKSLVSSWIDERHEAQRRRSPRPASPTTSTPPTFRPGPAADRASATSSAPTIGQERDAQDVALHRHGRADRRQQPPRGATGRPGPPRAGQRDRARQGDEVRVPDERRFVDRGRRDGHREPRDEAGDGTADRACQPPRDDDGGDPGQRDHERPRPAANRRRSSAAAGASR